MKRIGILVVALAVLAPIRAEAFFLSCGTATNAILNGSSQQQGIAIGHSTGVVDMLAALTCFVRGSTCNCLERVITNNLDAYSEAISEELARCAVTTPNISAVGPAMRAARRVCG